MKGDALYWSLARALDVTVWGGEVEGTDNLSVDSPAVFISNHAAALGPIAAVASLPLRVYPWVVGDMLDFAKAAEYLRLDFVEPQLHVPRAFSPLLARLISVLSVRLLRAVESIPVLQGGPLHETYRLSVDYLAQGRSLLIFPEDPAGPLNELYGMRPFKKGFARLGEMLYARTGAILHFHPLAVHPARRKVKFGRPIPFNPFNDPADERRRLTHVLEATIHDLYLTLHPDAYAREPLPR